MHLHNELNCWLCNHVDIVNRTSQPACGYEFYLLVFTCSLRSLVRYRVEHSKIKLVPKRGHEISSLYRLTVFYIA